MNINMKDENDKTENMLFYPAPPTPLLEEEDLSNIYYNCTECPSLIEIISINENNNILEFKCLNKNNIHNNDNIIISIKDYLRLMLKYKNENLKDLCEIHKNNNYICYCYKCEKQLCKLCLKTKTHMNHKKKIIFELQPDEIELNIVKSKLEEFEKIINKFKIEKQKKIKELNKLNNYKKNENKIIGDIIEKDKINKEKELKSNDDKYFNDIKEIKKRFEKEIILRKSIYEKEKRNINNKYYLKIDKEKIKYQYKIQKMYENCNEIINDLSKKIENLLDIKRLNEIIYKTYNNFKNNYYYAMNLKIISFDSIIKKLKSKEEKRISYKKEKYNNNIEKLLIENESIFFSYDILKENINKSNQIKININDKEKENLKYMISDSSEVLNSIDVNNKNLIRIITELKGMKEIEDKEREVYELKENNKDKDNKKKRKRRKCDYVGLRNKVSYKGSYSYLISIIQQLFHISVFKYSIMNVDYKKEPIKSKYLKDDNILHQLEKLFIYLSFTSYGEVIPKEFISSVKDLDGYDSIGPNMDILEFFLFILCDKIEESLKGTKNEFLIKNLFIGEICHIKICNSCNRISLRYEDFRIIFLEVEKSENIYKSLDKIISNYNKNGNYDYCSKCYQRVTLNTFISNLPNILVFQLNIFYWPYSSYLKHRKINCKFEFPIVLDLNLLFNENIFLKKLN